MACGPQKAVRVSHFSEILLWESSAPNGAIHFLLRMIGRRLLAERGCRAHQPESSDLQMDSERWKESVRNTFRRCNISMCPSAIGSCLYAISTRTTQREWRSIIPSIFSPNRIIYDLFYLSKNYNWLIVGGGGKWTFCWILQLVFEENVGIMMFSSSSANKVS